MNPLFAAALELQQLLEARGWQFCFIGGLAVQRWGEPRLTLDVDCTIQTGFGGERGYIDTLLAAFAARGDRPREFALDNRVLLLTAGNGVPLDLSLGAMPFEAHAVGRATAFDIGHGQTLRTCSAEDLIVFKAFAGRDRDWLDIQGVVSRQGRQLNHDVIWRELLPLLELKEDDLAEPKLRQLLGAN